MPLSSVVGAQSIVRPGVCTSSTRPASPYDGQVIYETDTDKTLVWNGSGWVFLSTSRANPGGLDFIKAQTIGSAVSSVTVSDAFSSTYDAYEVIVSGGAGSTNLEINLTFGSATSNYRWGVVGHNYAASLTANGSFSASSIALVGTANTTSISLSMRVINPFLSEQTMVATNLWFDNTNIGRGHGYLNDTNSYTSFTLTPNTGTLTGGTIRVYGYVNS